MSENNIVDIMTEVNEKLINDFSEMEKLARDLDANGYTFEIIHETTPVYHLHRNQIWVWTDKTKTDTLFDAICHIGSYGYEQGLIEIMGDRLMTEQDGGGSVAGWLTADQVIERLKRWEERR